MRSAAAQPTVTPGATRRELRELLVLAAPLAVAQLGQMLIGGAGTAMAGRIGEVALGAVGLGNALFFALSVLGVGVMLGLDPLVSQALGANEPRTARAVFWQGAWLSLLLAVPLGLLVVAIAELLPWFGVTEATATRTQMYLYSRLPSLWPFLLGFGARSYLQALGITRPLVVGVLVANVINVALGCVFVFGDRALEAVHLPPAGLGEHGVAGIGWANVAATVTVAIAMLLPLARITVPAGPRRLRRPDRQLLSRAVRLGAPLGLQLLAEVGMFSIVTVLMGRIGERARAAHQVALTLASCTFTVALAIGAAAAVRVGRAVGRADGPATRRAGALAFAAGAAFMTLSAVVFLSMPGLLARMLTDEPEVIGAAVPLLVVAAAFQLGDGIQAVGAGALRGAGDTRVSMIANIVGHYALGLPVGLVLAFVLGWGAEGLWWGLTAGLSAVAALLAIRFARLTARPVARS